MLENEVGCCDRCGLEVLPENDAVWLELTAVFSEKSIVVLFSTHPRHLFPVIHGTQVVCKGSSEMAQYLGGPRDYSHPYDPKQETILREAFKKMREKKTTPQTEGKT